MIECILFLTIFLSYFRNIAKHVTEFVLHGIGVLLNCVDLTRLISRSSALTVCLKTTTETIVLVREKDELLAAIDRSSPSPSVPEDIYSANDQDQDDAAIEIEPQSGKIRQISPLKRCVK